MAPHSSTLAWKILWSEEPGRLQSMGSLRVRHDWTTSLSLFTFMHWRRKWQPTPVFLPGESQGRGSLVGCRLWGRTESDTTDAMQQQQQSEEVFVLFFINFFYNSEPKCMVENFSSSKFQERIIIIGKQILVKRQEILLFKFNKRDVWHGRDIIKAKTQNSWFSDRSWSKMKMESPFLMT